MVPAIIGTITFGIYKLFELFARRRERIMLIEKIGEINSIDMSKIVLPSYNSGFSASALKGGCLLTGLGLGLLIGFFICMSCMPNYFENAKHWEYKQTAGIIYGSSVLFFGGIGLIVAFIIEVKLGRRAKNKA